MKKLDKEEEKIGRCALCDREEIALMVSHSIPKFVYDWMKVTSPTPYLRDGDNVNEREQDGPKEHLLCADCELCLSQMENELSKRFFKKIANYRNQAETISITESMRVGVLSIFWRALLTTANRDRNLTQEDQALVSAFLASAKEQIKSAKVTTKIYIAPFYGKPPFFGLPKQYTYLLDRLTGAQDIRFFDNPHRYFAVFKIPFMFFYIRSEGWADQPDPDAEFVGDLTLSKIQRIPDVLKNYIHKIVGDFNASSARMRPEIREQIRRDVSMHAHTTGSDKSADRSQ